MNTTDARHLLAYDVWANDQIIRCIEGLSEEQYTREIVSSFPSIRDTLAHLVSVEWVWFQRWNGTSPTAAPEWTREASAETLRAQLNEVETARAAFVEAMTENDLEREVSYRNLKGESFAYPLRKLIQHLVNHSTYHRGQLTTMLRQVGAVPPGTDYLLF